MTTGEIVAWALCAALALLCAGQARYNVTLERALASEREYKRELLLWIASMLGKKKRKGDGNGSAPTDD